MNCNLYELAKLDFVDNIYPNIYSLKQLSIIKERILFYLIYTIHI